MKIFKLFFILLLLVISLLTVTNAAAPSWWYIPWSTLDPECSPWDTDCFVKNTSVTWNTTITWATKTKITYDSKWLVTSGSTLIESDIPSLSLSKIINLVTSLASKLNISDIIDNLTSTDTNKPLSANQGKILKDLVDTKVNSWSLSTVATSWNYTDLSNKPDLSVYDEVEQYSNSGWFPWTWNITKFYLAQDTWLMYRWTGSSYSIISWKLALWETSSTAYRWDYGKALKDKQDTQQTAIDLNTAKVTNATHTGDVTGDTALAIGDDKITTSKIANTNVTKAKLNSDVFNNTLTSDATDEALTAKQGKELKTLVDEKVKKVTSTDNAIVRFDGTTGEVQNSDVTIKDNGYLGVNTTNPTMPLHVNAGSLFDGGVYLYGTNNPAVKIQDTNAYMTIFTRASDSGFYTSHSNGFRFLSNYIRFGNR
jgi:hypothetical protein